MRHGGTGAAVIAALVGTVVFGVGCGSGGGGLPRGTPVILEIESLGRLDGFVRNDGLVSTAGNGPGVGDLDQARQGLAFRMFYAFPLADIPRDVVVTSVRLRVFQLSITGTPYANLGDLLVDHVAPGPALDAADYAGNTLDSNIGVLATGFGQNYANLGVANEVQADLEADRSVTWFRLRFPVDSNFDGGNDVLLLDDGEGSRGSPQVPLLEVTYVRP